MPAMSQPGLLAAGIGVGVCPAVITYVTDQLAMARLPRAMFAFLRATLSACATCISVVVLRQIPTMQGIAELLLAVG